MRARHRAPGEVVPDIAATAAQMSAAIRLTWPNTVARILDARIRNGRTDPGNGMTKD